MFCVWFMQLLYNINYHQRSQGIRNFSSWLLKNTTGNRYSRKECIFFNNGKRLKELLRYKSYRLVPSNLNYSNVHSNITVSVNPSFKKSTSNFINTMKALVKIYVWCANLIPRQCYKIQQGHEKKNFKRVRMRSCVSTLHPVQIHLFLSFL